MVAVGDTTGFAAECCADASSGGLSSTSNVWTGWRVRRSSQCSTPTRPSSSDDATGSSGGDGGGVDGCNGDGSGATRSRRAAIPRNLLNIEVTTATIPLLSASSMVIFPAGSITTPSNSDFEFARRSPAALTTGVLASPDPLVQKTESVVRHQAGSTAVKMVARTPKNTT